MTGDPRGLGAWLVDAALDRSVVGGYSKFGYAMRRRLSNWPDDPPAGALVGREALVTGASSGLGKQSCADLAGLGARVHLVVRNLQKGEVVRRELLEQLPDSEFVLWRCDVSDLRDVERFCQEYAAESGRLDVLVHNAGVMPAQRTESAQGHELAMATHVLGPLRLTESLRPQLAVSGSSRVVLVTSGGMYAQQLPVTDPEYRRGGYHGATAYARSKRVQVALLPVLTRRWSADGISVHAMHPGWADTPGIADSLPLFHRVTRPILRDDSEGADTTAWLAAAEPPPPSGMLWQDRRPRPEHVVPWTKETESAQQSMWQWCALTVGIESAN